MQTHLFRASSCLCVPLEVRLNVYSSTILQVLSVSTRHGSHKQKRCGYVGRRSRNTILVGEMHGVLPTSVMITTSCYMLQSTLLLLLLPRQVFSASFPASRRGGNGSRQIRRLTTSRRLCGVDPEGSSKTTAPRPLVYDEPCSNLLPLDSPFPEHSQADSCVARQHVAEDGTPATAQISNY